MPFCRSEFYKTSFSFSGYAHFTNYKHSLFEFCYNKWFVCVLNEIFTKGRILIFHELKLNKSCRNLDSVSSNLECPSRKIKTRLITQTGKFSEFLWNGISIIFALDFLFVSHSEIFLWTINSSNFNVNSKSVSNM